jgi:hypothetical protein
VVVIPLEKMAEEGWTEACLRKAGARFYKKTMSWRVPEEAWPPERKETEDMETKTVTVVQEKVKEDVVVDIVENIVENIVEDIVEDIVEKVEEDDRIEIVVVDASTQCDDFRPRLEYGVGPEEKVIERMMRYLRR